MEVVCKIIDGKIYLLACLLAFLRGHSGNKVYKLLFFCNPYHQLSAIKDIASFSLVFLFFIVKYIFLEVVCKIIDGKIYLLACLLAYLLTY